MNKLIAVPILASLLLVTAFAVAQTRRGGVTDKKDDVPQAALLTERGAALAQRLKWLRRSVANMGPKHPSLPNAQKEINSIKEELKAWAPAPSPFENTDDTGARAVPKMNDEDLRQLVLRLSNEVESLKTRVSQLERRQ